MRRYMDAVESPKTESLDVLVAAHQFAYLPRSTTKVHPNLTALSSAMSVTLSFNLEISDHHSLILDLVAEGPFVHPVLSVWALCEGLLRTAHKTPSQENLLSTDSIWAASPQIPSDFDPDSAETDATYPKWSLLVRYLGALLLPHSTKHHSEGCILLGGITNEVFAGAAVYSNQEHVFLTMAIYCHLTLLWGVRSTHEHWSEPPADRRFNHLEILERIRPFESMRDMPSHVRSDAAVLFHGMRSAIRQLCARVSSIPLDSERAKVLLKVYAGTFFRHFVPTSYCFTIGDAEVCLRLLLQLPGIGFWFGHRDALQYLWVAFLRTTLDSWTTICEGHPITATDDLEKRSELQSLCETLSRHESLTILLHILGPAVYAALHVEYLQPLRKLVNVTTSTDSDLISWRSAMEDVLDVTLEPERLLIVPVAANGLDINVPAELILCIGQLLEDLERIARRVCSAPDFQPYERIYLALDVTDADAIEYVRITSWSPSHSLTPVPATNQSP